MKILRILSALFFISLWASMAYANIYSWTDENGVTHFTNYNPPAEARIVVKDVVIPRGEATEKEARANEEPVGKPSESERDLEERGLDLERKLEGSLERAEDLVENLETRLIEANRRARQAEALARDVERRVFEANREAEDAIRNAEALAEEPYPAEPDYYSRLTYPYAYGYGFVSIHRPAFHYKRHFSKPYFRRHHLGFHYKHRFTRPRFKKHHSSLHPKRHFSRSHFTKHHGGLHHKRHFSGAHFSRRHSGFHLKVHFGGRHSRR